MKISVGSDHRGVSQRKAAAQAAEDLGHTVFQTGPTSDESCDYPDIAAQVARAVARGETDRGILICGTGIGMSIAANKVRGIRAAVASDLESAQLSRRHNDANVLCLPGNTLTDSEIDELVHVWLTTKFEGGRHQLRLDKIRELENAG